MDATAEDNPPQPWETDFRLPKDTVPLHYDLYLFPQLDQDTFTGKVTIEVETSKPRSFFLVHALHLNITKTSVTTFDHHDVPVEEAFAHQSNEFWVVKLKSDGPLAPAGNYRLIFEFDGRLDLAIVGFYRSDYHLADGPHGSKKRRFLATSKFQPTYARRCFPCFDEPCFKATFSTTLIRPSDPSYVALSNMTVVRSKPDTPEVGFTEVQFLKSVPMVTYLAVFIVCDFVHFETTLRNGKLPMKVYGHLGQEKTFEYAAAAGAAITEFFEGYFNIRYPLPKLDMAAIPDYPSGATEHWGLITFAQKNVLYDPDRSSFSDKVRVASVIAHEISHQWFGNLVTVAWWNDIWLQEGFSSYMEYKGVENFEKTWDMESLFLTTDLHPVMDHDAKKSSRAIVADVSTPSQVSAIFDIISYNKGAAVIRMMENFMGEEKFRQGIHNFLVKYSYGTVVTQDLFDELSAISSQQSSLDISKIMDSWTKQKGLPVLTAVRDGNVYTLTQERFLMVQGAQVEDNDDDDDRSPFNHKWEVPVTYVTSRDPEAVSQVWFHIEDPFIKIDVGEGTTWTKFNVRQVGYYRVSYPIEEWAAFRQILLNGNHCLTAADRTSLINDAFSLADGGRLPYSVPLDLVGYLLKEKNYAPWQTAMKHLLGLMDLLRVHDDVIYYALKDYIRELISPMYSSLGWGDSQATQASSESSFHRLLLRALIISAACQTGVKECQKVAELKFEAWRVDGVEIPLDFKDAVYCHAMKKADFDTWDWMLDRYKAETNVQEKSRLLNSLAAAEDPLLVERLLAMLGDPEVVRSQDYFFLLAAMSKNPESCPTVWNFYRKEWDHLVKRFGLTDRVFGRVIVPLSSGFCCQSRLDEMTEFFAKHPEAGAGANNRKIALETVASNIRFVEKIGPEICNWLIDRRE